MCPIKLNATKEECQKAWECEGLADNLHHYLGPLKFLELQQLNKKAYNVKIDKIQGLRLKSPHLLFTWCHGNYGLEESVICYRPCKNDDLNELKILKTHVRAKREFQRLSRVCNLSIE